MSFFKKKEIKIEDKETKIKDFNSLRLCKYKDGNRLWVNVDAAIRNGCLLISGQDLGDQVSEWYDDSDYEYWYSFDIENTKLLIAKLSEQKSTSSVKKLLSDNFSGLEGCSNLRSFCKEFGIKYDYSSYI